MNMTPGQKVCPPFNILDLGKMRAFITYLWSLHIVECYAKACNISFNISITTLCGRDYCYPCFIDVITGSGLHSCHVAEPRMKPMFVWIHGSSSLLWGTLLLGRTEMRLHYSWYDKRSSFLLRERVLGATAVGSILISIIKCLIFHA